MSDVKNSTRDYAKPVQDLVAAVPATLALLRGPIACARNRTGISR